MVRNKKWSLLHSTRKYLNELGCVFLEENVSFGKADDKQVDLVGYIVDKQGRKASQVIVDVSEAITVKEHKKMQQAAKALNAPYVLMVSGENKHWISAESWLELSEEPRFESNGEYIFDPDEVAAIIIKTYNDCEEEIKSMFWLRTYLIPYVLLTRAFSFDNDRMYDWFELTIFPKKFFSLLEEAGNFYYVNIDKDFLEESNGYANINKLITRWAESLDSVAPVHPANRLAYLKCIEKRVGIIWDHPFFGGCIRSDCFGSKDNKHLSPIAISQDASFVLRNTPQFITQIVADIAEALELDGEMGIEISNGHDLMLYDVMARTKLNDWYVTKARMEVLELSEIIAQISGLGDVIFKVNDLENEEEKYSMVLLNPSLADSLRMKSSSKYAILKGPDDREKVYNVEFSLEEAISLAKPGGYIIAVVPDIILYSVSTNVIKDYIKDNTIIESIISLPAHILKPINVSLMVMRKKETSDETAEEIFLGKLTSTELSQEYQQFIAAFKTWKDRNCHGHE